VYKITCHLNYIYKILFITTIIFYSPPPLPQSDWWQTRTRISRCRQTRKKKLIWH